MFGLGPAKMEVEMDGAAKASHPTARNHSAPPLSPAVQPLSKAPKTEEQVAGIPVPSTAESRSSRGGGRAQKGGGRGQGTRQQRGGGQNAGLDQQMLIDVAKLTLRNSQQERILRSACVDCLVMQADNEIVTKMQESTKSFSDALQKLGKNAKPEQKAALGLPHLLAWQTLAETILEMINRDEGLKTRYADLLKAAADAQAVFNHITDPQLKTQELARQVRVCKLNKCWNSSIKRIEVTAVYGTTLG
eukprot:TRINITY_DN26659_c0_g3_i1.p2 TRINITY_DN26659_c0_g3~~TRINITY_DN26659_c0_g3_i1.p2  ORF type:complete len:247 (+),score=68.12 TRINITY_DN26659_c0_g3_i1:174-914(+)